MPIYLPCLLHDSFVHFHNTLSNLLIYSYIIYLVIIKRKLERVNINIYKPAGKLYNRSMKLTKKQYRKIEHLMPIPRKPPEISNYQFLCALLYMIENGCKWRALPKKYGKWHTIYMRFNRWSKNGTIKRIFEKMQELNIIDVRTDTLCIDSTSIKVHPDAAGARKSSGEQSIGRSKGG